MKMINWLGVAAICAAAAAISTDCVGDDFSHDVQGDRKPWTHESFYDKNETFQFAIVSDRTGGERRGVFPEAAKKLNLLRPEFVVSVGDLIEGYTDDEASLKRQWEEFDSYAKLFDMPFFYVPGNHDITNKVMDDMWHERYGPSYYSFTYKNVLFLCLDTQQSENYKLGKPGRYISEKQVAWAKEVLEKHKDVKWTCVLMHQPLWIYNQSKETGFNELEQVLVDRSYTVFAGHMHRYVKYERNDQKYFIFGTTGGGSKMRGKELGEFDHVVWVTMTKEGPVLANLLLDGIHDEDIRTEEMKIDQQREAYVVNSVKLTPDDSESTFSVSLSNSYEEGLNYRIVWADQAGWQIAPGEASGVLKAKSRKRVAFTITRSETRGGQSKVPTGVVKLESSKLEKTIELSSRGIVRHFFPPAYEAAEATAAPVIDGRLDDQLWRNTPPIAGFRANESNDDLSAETTVRVAYDKQGLYVAVRALEPNPEGIVARVEKRDGDVWRDDSVELFLDTNRDRETYYHLIVNSLGTVYDGIGKSKAHDIEAQVATSRDGDGWAVELAIPWSELRVEPAESGDTWGVAFVRTRPQAREQQQMPFLYGENHQPDMFGDLKFAD